MSVEQAYHGLGVVAMAVLMVLASELYDEADYIRGPRVSDRVLAVNMVGTLTIIMVGVMVVMLGEGYLADVALVYAMISFLAVVVLCKVYTGIYRERRHEEERLRAEDSRKETDK